MTHPAFETRSLTKHYGAATALDRVDLTLGRTEILGCIGPNGAGKSTFIKALLGIVRLTSGAGTVLGLDLERDTTAIRARVGYVPGDLGVYRNWRAEEFVRFCVGFHPRGDLDRAKQLAAHMGLPLRQRVRTYSSGMRQKLGILQALSVHADLLLLDEPTRGLDPTSQLEFRDLIRDARAQGAAVLLSSHMLDEIASVCDRLVFIDRGRLVDEGAIARVRERWRGLMFVEVARGPLDATANLPGVTHIAREGAGYRLTFEGDPQPLLESLLARGIVSIDYNRPALEDLYREIYVRESAR